MSRKTLLEYKKLLATVLFKYHGKDLPSELKALSRLTDLWEEMADHEQEAAEEVSKKIADGSLSIEDFYWQAHLNQFDSSADRGGVKYSISSTPQKSLINLALVNGRRHLPSSEIRIFPSKAVSQTTAVSEQFSVYRTRQADVYASAQGNMR